MTWVPTSALPCTSVHCPASVCYRSNLCRLTTLKTAHSQPFGPKLRRMRKTLTIAALTILTLTACAPKSDTLGEGTDTGTYGILVPDTATKTNETTWQIPDAKHKDVEAWLEEKLPVNASAKELTYCDSDKTDSTTSWYWWNAETPADADGTPWLTVRVTDQKPVTITVDYNPNDPSGPC